MNVEGRTRKGERAMLSPPEGYTPQEGGQTASVKRHMSNGNDDAMEIFIYG